MIGPEHEALIDETVPAIAAAFAAAGWTWSVRDRESVAPYVPNAEDIRKTLRRMLASILDEDLTGALHSGRLSVFREYEDGDVVFGIEIRVTGYEGED